MSISWRQLTRPTVIRELMDRHGLSFKRSLGQNFLLDPGAVTRMVALSGLKAGERALEIGPGVGVLTGALAETGAAVTAVEIDGRLLPALAETLPPQVRLIHGDALALDPAELTGPEPTRLVANLPYYITTDLLLRLLPYVASATVMVQKEAVGRILAQPGQEGWGPLGVLVRRLFIPGGSFAVGAGCFMPRPRVDSAVVHLERARPTPEDLPKFMALTRAVFAMRRKTLANNLAAWRPDLDRGALTRALAAAGVDPACRAETLSPAQLEKLFEIVNTLTC